MKGKYILYQPVRLNFYGEDFEDLDLGMSGIVLPSPAKRFKSRINEQFKYMGHILETDNCVIKSKYGNEYIIDYAYIINDDAMEYINNEHWINKNTLEYFW